MPWVMQGHPESPLLFVAIFHGVVGSFRIFVQFGQFHLPLKHFWLISSNSMYSEMKNNLHNNFLMLAKY